MTFRLKSFAGPLMAAMGAWCAAGSVAVADASGGTRLIVPAPLWALPLALGLAMLIRPWRRAPLLALPALLATMAWWPIPLPAVGLMWTGPMAWLPIGMALTSAAMANGAGSHVEDVEGLPTGTEPGGRASVVPWRTAASAAAATLVLSVLVAFWLAPRLPGGDEPHYLVITQSLLKDGDLQIKNNHDARDYAAYYGGTLTPDYIAKGKRGEIYSIHAPGLAVLVAPGFFVAGYRGAQATVVVLAALTAALVWLAGWLATGDRRAAWFAWAAITCSVTFLIQSVTIFPDGPGALVVAAAVVLLLVLDRDGPRVSRTSLVSLSIALAALPWLHTRFVVLSAGFGALVIASLLSDARVPWQGRQRRAMAFLAVPVLGAVAWFAFFQWLYGTPNPAAPYGSNPEVRAGYVPGGVAGLLFDQQFGLVTHAPVLLAAVAAFFIRPNAADRPLGRAVLIGLAYLMAVGTYWMWWAGVPAPPARFAAVALPVLAPALAVAWHRGSALGRAAWATLIGGSIATALVLIGVDHGVLGWSVRGEPSPWLSWLSPLVSLTGAWPSFFRDLTPGIVRTEAGFARHLAVSLVVTGIAAAAGAWLARSARATRAQQAVLGVALVAAGLTGVIQVGWWLSGEDAVAADRVQLSLLARAAAGAHVVRVGSFALSRAGDLNGLVTMRAVRAAEGSTWRPIERVPPGVYEVRVVTKRPAAALLAFRLGRSPMPFETAALRALSEQRIRLDLPAGADSLVISSDTPTFASNAVLELIPEKLAAGTPVYAVASWSAGHATAFFFDDHVYLEDGSFWVRGGETSEMMLTSRGAAQVVLENGGSANDVKVAIGSWTSTVSLSPGATLPLPPIPPEAGAARVSITSRSGFRPSDTGSSADRRYLGVRVTLAGE